MGTIIPLLTRLEMTQIGTEGLKGVKHDGLIFICGPCGEGHTMSLKAAAQLRDWLDEQLGGPPTTDVKL